MDTENLVADKLDFAQRAEADRLAETISDSCDPHYWASRLVLAESKLLAAERQNAERRESAARLSYAIGVNRAWNSAKDVMRENNARPDSMFEILGRKIDSVLSESPQVSHAELRPDIPEYGERCLDEVCASNATFVHVERMSDNNYWMGIDLADGRQVRVNFFTPRATIKCTAEIEESNSLPPAPKGAKSK